MNKTIHLTAKLHLIVKPYEFKDAISALRETEGICIRQ